MTSYSDLPVRPDWIDEIVDLVTDFATYKWDEEVDGRANPWAIRILYSNHSLENTAWRLDIVAPRLADNFMKEFTEIARKYDLNYYILPNEETTLVISVWSKVKTEEAG